MVLHQRIHRDPMVDREAGVREFKGTAGAELAKRSADLKEFKIRREVQGCEGP